MRITKLDVAFVAAIVAMAGLACKGGSKTDDAAKKSGGDTAEKAAEKADEKGEDGAGGKTDPKIDALAAKVLACDWKGEAFEYKCAKEPLEALNTSELVKDGKAEETFLVYLTDQKPGKRWLGAEGLKNAGGKYRTETEPAKRVLAAVEAEKDAGVAKSLGAVMGLIDADKAGLVDEVLAQAKGHPLEAMRAAYFSRTRFSNDKVYAAAFEAAKTDQSPTVRHAAFAAFWTGTPPGKKEDVCDLWLDRIKNDPTEREQAYASYLLLFNINQGCKQHYDETLTLIESRARSGKAQETQWGSSLGYLLKQKDLSPAHKARAIAVAKAIVENTANEGFARKYALEAIIEHDAAGMAYAEKFANDGNTFVKSAVAKAKEKK